MCGEQLSGRLRENIECLCHTRHYCRHQIEIDPGLTEITRNRQPGFWRTRRGLVDIAPEVARINRPQVRVRLMRKVRVRRPRVEYLPQKLCQIWCSRTPPRIDPTNSCRRHQHEAQFSERPPATTSLLSEPEELGRALGKYRAASPELAQEPFRNVPIVDIRGCTESDGVSPSQHARRRTCRTTAPSTSRSTAP